MNQKRKDLLGCVRPIGKSSTQAMTIGEFIMEPLRILSSVTPQKAESQGPYCGTDGTGSDWNGHDHRFRTKLSVRQNSVWHCPGPYSRPNTGLFLTGALSALDVSIQRRYWNCFGGLQADIRICLPVYFSRFCLLVREISSSALLYAIWAA